MEITLAFFIFLVVWFIMLFPGRAWIQKKKGLPQSWSLKSVSSDYQKAIKETNKKHQSTVWQLAPIIFLSGTSIVELFISGEVNSRILVIVFMLLCYCISLTITIEQLRKSIEGLEKKFLKSEDQDTESAQ
jgi:hypothetical protein